jgi:aspartate kinase
MTEIIRNQFGDNELLIIIVSAMAKTTNHLENILYETISGNDSHLLVLQLLNFHLDILKDLGIDPKDEIYKKVNGIVEELRTELKEISNSNTKSEAELYDRIVPFGELLSSTIVSHYINSQELKIEWLDARKFIKTTSDFREGIIDWTETEKQIQTLNGKEGMFMSQGFIGSDAHSSTTTLGREGSDFSAAIFGSCLKSESITIWKDVPGILNADPKLFNNTELFGNLSYSEASEMTYFGASVIHPKTIKPLANQGIELLVKSFKNPDAKGTVIGSNSSKRELPVFILKTNQVLLSFEVKDYTFINEEQIGSIFHALNECLIKINVMQNSAISLTIAVDDRNDKIQSLIAKLKLRFKISSVKGLSLITIINHKKESVESIEKDHDILLEQRSRNTCQYLVSNPVFKDRI